MHPDFLPAYQNYLECSANYDSALADPGDSLELVYAFLEEDEEPLYAFVEANRIHCGAPTIIKTFQAIRFFGKGTLYVRVLVDHEEVALGWVCLEKGPRRSDVFRLPEGTAGCELAVQVGGQWGESITARQRAAAPPAVPRQQTGGNRGWAMQ